MPAFNYQPQPYTGPSKEEVLALRKQFLSPCESRWREVQEDADAACSGWAGEPDIGQHSSAASSHAHTTMHVRAGLFHHFREPVMITEGKMQYLYDEEGRRYLDVSADRLGFASEWVAEEAFMSLMNALHSSWRGVLTNKQHTDRLAG